MNLIASYTFEIMKGAVRFIFFTSILALGHFASSQTVLRRELSVEADNDAYTLNLTRDQYYSNGVAIKYRRLMDSSRWKPKHQKVIRSYYINHRMYTPKRLYWTDTAQMDRPYAGHLTLAISNEYYFKNSSYLQARFEASWMGPSINTGNVQYEWHKFFNMQLPQGWKYEVNDSPILNIYGTYANTLVSEKGFDMLSETNWAGGTAFNYVRQEFVFRVGNFLPIYNSSLFNAVPGRVKDSGKQHEVFFFISPGIEYVIYNSTIEGNLLGEEAIYTEDQVDWVYQTRAGLLFSWTKFDFALFYYRRTKETTESFFHKYMGIRLTQRF